MKRGRLARFGFVLGLAGLFGCAPLPQPQVAVAPTPVAVAVPPPPPPPAPLPAPPMPVAVMPPPPAPVAIVPPPTPPAVAPHLVMHHRHYRRYAAVTGYYGPACGSDAHPCSVYHAIIPIQ